MGEDKKWVTSGDCCKSYCYKIITKDSDDENRLAV